MYNPCHPGEILREDYLKPMDISVTEFAKQIGVSRKVLSDVVNEKAGISPLMSLRLSKALNKSPQFWLIMQMNYDLFHVQKRSRKAISAVKSVKWKRGGKKIPA
ncbi:MAG: HigA family addiction module antidote protein [Cyclobacteriaceae bacterium]|nr:HigA family addiction module antidote protein [Cyclobacteriaceae bacterium]